MCGRELGGDDDASYVRYYHGCRQYPGNAGQFLQPDSSKFRNIHFEWDAFVDRTRYILYTILPEWYLYNR